MEKFYQRLKRFRLESGKSVKEMAKQIGVSVSTYRDWEYGRTINGEPYINIAKILGVSVETLMGGKTSTPRSIERKLIKCEEAITGLRKELESFF